MNKSSPGDGHQRLAQDLVVDAVAGRGRYVVALVDGVQRRADDRRWVDEVLDLGSGPHRQSLPEPHDDAGRSTGAPTKPRSRAVLSDPTVTPASGSRRRRRSSHTGPLVPPMAEQFGVERGDDEGGPIDARTLGDQARADRLDEVVDVFVDDGADPVWVVGCLVRASDGAPGDPQSFRPESWS